MKKWIVAIGLVLLLLVGVMPANIRQAEAAGIKDPTLPIDGTSASVFFKRVNISSKTIEGGDSASFSVSELTEAVSAVIQGGTLNITGIKWNVKKNGVDYTEDSDFSEMFAENFSGNAYTFTINAVEGNCILDGAKVSLTIYVSNLSTGENQTITFSETATLNISHTSGDWTVDEEASNGVLQVSNKTCTACGTVVDTKEEVAPLAEPVYVGGEALQNAGESIAGNSGTATLYIAQDGSPVLVLDNYVYTGAGYENTDDNYAGIYYGGSDTLYIFCGPNDGGRATSQNTITVTAEGAKCSRGIYVPNGTLHIGTTDNGTEDTLTATAGTATTYSNGIHAKEFKVQDDANVNLYTSTGVASAGQYALTSNCVINATGGTAEGYLLPCSYGINCTGDATFSGGKITATGGKASYEGVTAATPEAKTYGIKAATISISGADVTATGGTCGAATSGTSGNDAHSYGCYGDITMTSGSLTATGADLLEEAGHRVKESYGIRGSINVSGGTVIATGGNTINGLCYGIYATGDCIFSDTADVTIKTNDVTTDDDLYGLYLKDPATVTVADSAKVDITVATAGEYKTYGIYAYTGNNKYVQTGGTVTVSAAAKGTTAYGVWIQEAEISAGTLEVSNKQTAIIISNLTLNGGQVTGTSTGVEADAVYYSPYGVRITTLTMTGGSITGTGGASTHAHSEGVSITTTATVSGGTITGYGGRGVDNGDKERVMSYGVNIDGTLTLSGGTVKGTAGQAYSTSEGVYIKNAILSNSAQIVGQGGISDCDNSVGVSINDASVSDTVTITGTGGQATGSQASSTSVGVYIAKAVLNDNAKIVGQGGTSNSKDSIGVSFGSSITMGAESEAQVTGNGGSGANSMGIKFDGSTLSLLGGSLTATGGTGTTASYGLYTTNNFLMDGALLIAKGDTSAVGCDGKEEISSGVIVVSTDIAGTGTSPLQYGGHVISTLAEYKYLKAGTTGDVGAQPGKRDISGATITLASSTLTYSGSEQTMEVTSVKLGSVELLDEVTISGNTATDAGTYTLTVTAKDDSYYTGSAEKPFTVNRLSITPVVTVKEASYPYNSTIDPSDVIVKHGETELVYEKDYTIYSTWTGSVGENQGNVMVLSMESSNYYWHSTAKGTFTVVKAENPVVVEPTATVIRGGNYISLYNNLSQHVNAPSYTIKEPALGCTVTDGGGFTSGNETGEVTVILTFPETTNYNGITKEITVTITDKNKAMLNSVFQSGVTYGATLQDPQYSEPTGTQTRTITYEGTTLLEAAYPISSVKPTDAGNYTVYVVCETSDTIYSGNATFEISPKTVPGSNIQLANDELVYTGEPQTIEVTKVYDTALGKELVEGEDYVVTGNVQTNADSYQLTITGMGNYTGTATESYEITKAIPELGDFTIPSYTNTVDYTGVAVELPLPTTEKIGMGDVYFSSIPTNVGAHTIYFNVHDGDNYTAATNLEYGPLTINQIDRPTTVTDAEVIVGGNKIYLDNYVQTAGSPAKTYNIEGEARGCSIEGSYFTSGTETGTVRVRVTLDGGGSYRETVVWFNVTVKAKNTAPLTVTQPDVEYNYGEEILNLSPDFDGEAGTLVSQTMVYAGTLWNGSSYASSETKPTQAGTYTVTVTYESKDTIYTGSTTFKINRKQIGGTITLGPTLTYTGAPQTQTITNVQTGDYTYTEADYDVLGNEQTNAGTYTLTLAGKGNFTGTTSTSYTIAKATPQRSDFNIPVLTAVDYTGEYIPVALPTSIREGMGAVYLTGANIINAGIYEITFGVQSGKNYTATSGFAYGTLTVNKVAHPMEVTNAIVGIGGKNIDLNTRVTLESGYYASFEFVTPEAERHGCQINGATFFSGNEPVIVTVRATVNEAGNYLETSKTFTVEVVEEGGVKVYCSATCSCSNTDETTFQLLQDDVVKYETMSRNENPSVEFDGVAAGTYTLRVTKTDHLLCEREITVASEDLHEDVDGTNHRDEYTYFVNASDDTKHDKYLACCDKVLATEDHTPEYIPESTTIKGVCELCEKELGTVTVSYTGGTYNGSAYQVSVTGTGSLEAEVSELLVSYSKKNGASWDTLGGAPVDAGTYKASITLGEDSNTATVEVEFTIGLKELTVTGVTVANKVYDGSKSVTVTEVALSGIVGEDDVRVDTTGLLGTISSADAGTYRAIILPALTLVGEKAGNYTLVQPTGAVETSVTIEKAPAAPNLPEATKTVEFSVKKVSAVTLPTGWVWAAGDASKDLTAGIPVTAIAVYNGADKGNYSVETVVVSITRKACAHAGETELRDVATATCTVTGYTGDTYCLDCGKKIATGSVVNKQAHKDANSDNMCDKCGTTIVTATPTPKPTATPTPKPTATPTPKPTATPTPKPTATPTPKPTATATPKPTATPTPKPTATPAQKPDLSGLFATSNDGNFIKDGADVRCYNLDGSPVINEFRCDGTYTYYFQADGTAMRDRLTYHPDGEHVIYFDEDGHEVFSNFANVKKTISGEEVNDYCFFDVYGYLYVDVVTYDQSGTYLYYANPYGVMDRGKWFEFSDNVKWADGTPFDKAGGKYGYANADGTLMTNQWTYDWEGRMCYLQGNGVALYP